MLGSRVFCRATGSKRANALCQLLTPAADLHHELPRPTRANITFQKFCYSDAVGLYGTLAKRDQLMALILTLGYSALVLQSPVAINISLQLLIAHIRKLVHALALDANGQSGFQIG
ncbi:MAG: hypothetical protein WCF49_22010 [Xanthobacteraceae bacterium]|jgi:hypothetical protein